MLRPLYESSKVVAQKMTIAVRSLFFFVYRNVNLNIYVNSDARSSQGVFNLLVSVL